jgi:hypothetical protein
MLLRNDLDELLAYDQYPAISIYLPTHSAGREVRQDAIRLRNLLSTAAKRLAAAGRRAPEVDALLQPARKLIDDEEFWRYQEQGLAVFVGPGFDRVHKLPIAVPEELAISNHFCIKPLLPLIDPAGSFWVLALSAGRTRLYQGSRWTFAEVTGLDLPQGISEIWGETEYEEAHKASPTGRNLRASGGVANAQAFGETPGELHKAQLIELLHRLIAALDRARQMEGAAARGRSRISRCDADRGTAPQGPRRVRAARGADARRRARPSAKPARQRR